MTLQREAERAARDLRDTADILKGIPAYVSLFYTLDRIARDLERAVDEDRKDA